MKKKVLCMLLLIMLTMASIAVSQELTRTYLTSVTVNDTAWVKIGTGLGAPGAGSITIENLSNASIKVGFRDFGVNDTTNTWNIRKSNERTFRDRKSDTLLIKGGNGTVNIRVVKGGGFPFLEFGETNDWDSLNNTYARLFEDNTFTGTNYFNYAVIESLLVNFVGTATTVDATGEYRIDGVAGVGTIFNKQFSLVTNDVERGRIDNDTSMLKIDYLRGYTDGSGLFQLGATPKYYYQSSGSFFLYTPASANNTNLGIDFRMNPSDNLTAQARIEARKTNAVINSAEETDLLFYTKQPLTQVLTERFRLTANGKAGVNTPSISSSAIFEITSTTGGFLPPRMTQAQREAIGSPAVGLIVYQTNGTEGLYINTSGGWVQL